jgi:hypothetical protein
VFFAASPATAFSATPIECDASCSGLPVAAGPILAFGLLTRSRPAEDLRVSKSENDEEVAEAILGYLEEHPHATDTVEGIAEWWIMRQQIRVNATTVTRVLQDLMERGLVEELGAGEQRRYRLKR